MDIHTSARLERADVHKKGVKLTSEDQKGETRELDVERVLSAVGRVPNTETGCPGAAAAISLAT